MRYNKQTEMMKEQASMDQLMSVCCGMPRGDELPQVAGIDDIIADVYSDILNVSHEYAAGVMLHQYDDAFDFEEMIH